MPAMTDPHMAEANQAWARSHPDSYYSKPPKPSRFDSPQGEIVGLLKSIRSMLVFFVVLAVLGLIAGVVFGLIAATKDPRTFGLTGLRLR